MSQLGRALHAAKLDLLLLGALADRLRRAERGDVVRVYFDAPSDGDATVFDERPADGHSFCRAVAEARLTGQGAIRVDTEAVGLQLAQVALAFGADEWIVPTKLSLRLYGEEHTRLAVLREREIATLVRAAGRAPRFVVGGVERDLDETTLATRRFRAPGRETKEAT